MSWKYLLTSITSLILLMARAGHAQLLTSHLPGYIVNAIAHEEHTRNICGALTAEV